MMSFEVPPSPVPAKRPGRPVLAFAAALSVLVAVAVATRGPAPAAAPRPAANAAHASSGAIGFVASPAAPASPVRPSIPATSSPTRTLPPHVVCRQIDDTTCQAMARAALALLTPSVPAITTVTVYRSLLCDNDQDCPRALLARSRPPWGSVVVDFADGSPPAWINVVTDAASPRPPAWEAWIID